MKSHATGWEEMPTTIRGCSQAVRHGTLTPARTGSNPVIPATMQHWCNRKHHSLPSCWRGFEPLVLLHGFFAENPHCLHLLLLSPGGAYPFTPSGQYIGVAQSAEQWSPKPQTEGAIPSSGAKQDPPHLSPTCPRRDIRRYRLHEVGADRQRRDAVSARIASKSGAI